MSLTSLTSHIVGVTKSCNIAIYISYLNLNHLNYIFLKKKYRARRQLLALLLVSSDKWTDSQRGNRQLTFANLKTCSARISALRMRSTLSVRVYHTSDSILSTHLKNTSQ